MSESPVREARVRALACLARREHSRHELIGKLTARGCALELAERVAAGLVEEGLLSDERFAEGWVHARRARGYGPVRIRQELRERGVEEEVIERWLYSFDSAWGELACRARERRFRGPPDPGPAGRAREERFLRARGFDSGQIRQALRKRHNDDE